jgi:paraquat-inducible protein B
MSRGANNFKVGLFVIAAALLVAFVLIFFGAGFLEEETLMVETYLDESVQGIDRGSPVKMRGVQIGRIESIDFVRNEYPEAKDPQGGPIRFILIRMAIKPASVLPDTGGDLTSTLQREVENGLRVRLTAQGLTGLAYLELDYVGPDSPAPVNVTWTPNVVYVPSSPSIKSRVTETADEVFGSIRGADIERTLSNLNTFLVSLTSMLESLNIASIQEESVGLVRDVRATNAQLLEWMQQTDLEGVTSETLAVARSARRIADQLEGNSEQLLKEFTNVSRDLASVTHRIDQLLASEELATSTENIAATSEALRKASESLPQTMESLNGVILRVERIVGSGQGDMEEILENLRKVSKNMADLTEEAKRNPAGVFFGGAPPRSDPSGGRR